MVLPPVSVVFLGQVEHFFLSSLLLEVHLPLVVLGLEELLKALYLGVFLLGLLSCDEFWFESAFF
jgi:hypothetical protein